MLLVSLYCFVSIIIIGQLLLLDIVLFTTLEQNIIIVVVGIATFTIDIETPTTTIITCRSIIIIITIELLLEQAFG